MSKKIEYTNKMINYLAHHGFKTDRKLHLVCWRTKNSYTQKKAMVFKHHNWIFRDEIVVMLGNGAIQIYDTDPRAIGLNVDINNTFADAIDYANRWFDNPNSRVFKYDAKVGA